MAYRDVLEQVKEEVQKHTGTPLMEITEDTMIGDKVADIAGAFGVQKFATRMTVGQLALVVAEKREFPPQKSSEWHRM